MAQHRGQHKASKAMIGLAIASTSVVANSADPTPSQTAPKLLVGEQTLNTAIAHDFVHPGHGKRIHLYLDSNSRLDETGKLTGFNDSGSVIWKNRVADSHNDGTVAWGRWALGHIDGSGDHGNFEITGGEGARKSLYYVVGEPVEQSELDDAEAAALTASFSLLGGGVAPTVGEGGGASITYINEADLTAHFESDSVDVNFDITVPSGNYIVTMKGLALSGNGFTMAAETTVESTGTLCVAGCSATMVGFFAGERIARAAIAYNIVNNALSRDINGVIIFTRE